MIEPRLRGVACRLQRRGDFLRLGGDVGGLAAQVVQRGIGDLVVLHGLLDLVELAAQVVDLLGGAGAGVVRLRESGPGTGEEEGDEEYSQDTHGWIIEGRDYQGQTRHMR